MTVKELRDRLQSIPQEALVVIEDADTNWYLELEDEESIRVEDNLMILSLLSSHHRRWRHARRGRANYRQKLTEPL